MGRRKIDIKPIQNDRNRYTTFGKRKSGLFKKARELAVLCQVDIAVVIVNKNDNKKVFEYTNISSVDEVVRKRNKIRDNHGSISRSYISEDGESVRDDDISGDYDGEQDQEDDYTSSGKASVASIKTENVREASIPVEGQTHTRSHSRPKLKVQIPDSASDSGQSNGNTSNNMGNPSLRIMPPDHDPTNPHGGRQGLSHDNDGKAATDPEAAAQMNQNMQVPPPPGMYPSPVYFGQFGPNGQPIQMTPTQGISPGNGSYFPGFTPLVPQGYYGYPLQPRYNGPYQMPGQAPGMTDPSDPAYRQSHYAAHPEADGEPKMPAKYPGHVRHPSQSRQGDSTLQNTNGPQPSQSPVDSQGSKGAQKADGLQGPHPQNRNAGLDQQMTQHNEVNRSHAAQSGANGPNTFLYKPNFPSTPGNPHHPANGPNSHQQGGPSGFPAGQQPQGGPSQGQNGKYVNDFLMSPTNYFSMEWGVWDPQASAGPNGSAKAIPTPTTDENRSADESQQHRPPMHSVQQAAHSQGLPANHPSTRQDSQVNRNISYNNDPSQSLPSNIPAKRESDQEPSIPAKQSKKEL